MTVLRALHQLSADQGEDADLVAYAHRLRKEAGCIEAECYRDISDASNAAIIELWQDQYAYGEHWSRVVADPERDLVHRGASRLPQGCASTEFYRHQYFYPDRSWTAVDHKDRPQKIRWPAAGAVRVLIQLSLADVDAALPALGANAEETKREPGCLEFEWFRSVEYPRHVLLLELWRDQAIYDAHWQLRISSGSGGFGEQAPRQHGSNGVEFYRQQRFSHLYERWMPCDVTKRSETVIWPD